MNLRRKATTTTAPRAHLASKSALDAARARCVQACELAGAAVRDVQRTQARGLSAKRAIDSMTTAMVNMSRAWRHLYRLEARRGR